MRGLGHMHKLLLLFCFYIPFQLALNPAEGVDLASGRVFVLVLALMWLISAFKNRQVFIPAKTQTILLLSFLFLSAFSILWAKNPNWGLRKLLFLLSIFPIYFVGYGLLKNKNGVLGVVKALIWGTGIAALAGLIQFSLQFSWGLDNILKFWAGSVAPIFLGTAFSEAVLTFPSWLVNLGRDTVFRAISTFPDPHMFSIYLGMALPLAIGLYFSAKKNIYLILAVVIFLANLLTFSRGGYVGLAVGGLFFLAVMIKNKKPNLKKIAIGLTLVIVFLAFIFSSPIGARFLTSFNEKEGSNMGRIETWEEAVGIIKKNPLGVGLGNYALERKATADYREPIYAHNLYLDIAAETGIPNAIIWILLMIFSIKSFMIKSRDNIFWLGGAAGLVIFSVHSLFETALFSVQALPFLLIIISLSTIDDNKNN
jgi:O-antigen ligase